MSLLWRADAAHHDNPRALASQPRLLRKGDKSQPCPTASQKTPRRMITIPAILTARIFRIHGRGAGGICTGAAIYSLESPFADVESTNWRARFHHARPNHPLWMLPGLFERRFGHYPAGRAKTQNA